MSSEQPPLDLPEDAADEALQYIIPDHNYSYGFRGAVESSALDYCAEVESVGPASADSAGLGGSVPSEEAPVSALKSVVDIVRRNKVTAFAGAVVVGSIVANPLGEGLDQLDGGTLAGVVAGMGAAEAFWIGGAAMAWKAGGGRFTLNPGRLRSAFKGLSRQSVKDNRRLFDAGIAINTSAAVAQMTIPSAAIVANLPPSYWQLTALAGLELWATLQIRRKILSRAKGEP